MRGRYNVTINYCIDVMMNFTYMNSDLRNKKTQTHYSFYMAACLHVGVCTNLLPL